VRLLVVRFDSLDPGDRRACSCAFAVLSCAFSPSQSTPAKTYDALVNQPLLRLPGFPGYFFSSGYG
jgi:hypothetical protein